MKSTIISRDIRNNPYEVPVDQLKWRPAAYGIVISNDKILLTRQFGTYHLPGGGLEFGEMPEESVIREIKEETGINAGNPQLIDSLSSYFTWFEEDNPEPIHVQSILMYYRCEYIGGELSVEGFDENEKKYGELAEWISLDCLDSIRAGSTINWREVVKRHIINTG